MDTLQRHPGPWNVTPGPYGALMLRDARGLGFATLPAIARDMPRREEHLAAREADAATLAALPDLVAALLVAKEVIEARGDNATAFVTDALAKVGA